MVTRTLLWPITPLIKEFIATRIEYDATSGVHYSAILGYFNLLCKSMEMKTFLGGNVTCMLVDNCMVVTRDIAVSHETMSTVLSFAQPRSCILMHRDCTLIIEVVQ